MLQILRNILDPIQLIGYIGMAFALTSYQCKKNKQYFLLQVGCAMAFTIQYIFLSSWAAVLLNIFSIMRGIIFALGDKCKKTIFLIMIEASFALSCLVSALFFGEKWWIAFLLFIAQCGGTLAMWTRDGKKIRIAQLSIISPIWITNNIYYGSIGGIACEIFNIVSVTISMIRFNKIGYDKE